jgi:hypothetical protein
LTGRRRICAAGTAARRAGAETEVRSPRRAEPGEAGARARGLDYDGGEGSGWAARAGRVDVAMTPEMDAGQTQD